MKLLVISYRNKINKDSTNYEISLKNNNINYVMLGLGDKWTGFISSKIQRIYNFLITENTDADIVAITDCHDVLCCADENEILYKYQSFNKELVVGGEALCSGKCISVYNPKNKIKYMNGGFYIGSKNRIIDLFKYMIDRIDLFKDIDQDGMKYYYLQHYDNIALDANRLLVVNRNFLLLPNIKAIKNGRIFLKNSNVSPCFIHFPASKADSGFERDIVGRKIVSGYLTKSFIERFGDLKGFNLAMKYSLIIIMIILLSFCFMGPKVASKLLLGYVIIVILLIITIYSCSKYYYE